MLELLVCCRTSGAGDRAGSTVRAPRVIQPYIRATSFLSIEFANGRMAPQKSSVSKKKFSAMEKFSERKIPQPALRRINTRGQWRKARIVTNESDYFFLLLYGAWLVGLSETPSLDAFERTAVSVLPNFRPITRVGVFSLASAPSCLTSSFVHSLPVFLVYFGMIDLLVRRVFYRLA
jgi:hypothetical protein